MRLLASESATLCKLSGLCTEAGSQPVHRELLAPWVHEVFDAFEPQRVLWGSDWPVLELAAQYSA